MAPLVSIGMPVYNGERFIVETIDSLLKQTFTDFEIIVCDNSSTDNTETICRDFAKSDKRIRYHRNPQNYGAATNYRLTFELSKGKFFRWANCDDLFHPDSITKCLNILDCNPSVILVYPKTKFIDEKSKVISKYDDNLHLVSDSVCWRFERAITDIGFNNVIYGLIRSKILRKTGLIRSFEGGDLVLVAELSLYGKFWEIPEFLFYRRIHAGAHSNIKDIQEVQEFFDPATKGKIPFSEWRQLIANFISMAKSPIQLENKLRLLFVLLKLSNWKRRRLVNEIFEAYKLKIRKMK